MNYIIIICASIVVIHFILYYLNIDPFELSNKNQSNDTKNNVNSIFVKDIKESINELKKLNEYIDNESRTITQC